MMKLSPCYPLTINLARKGLFVTFLHDDSFFICIFLHNAICSNNLTQKTYFLTTNSRDFLKKAEEGRWMCCVLSSFFRIQ